MATGAITAAAYLTGPGILYSAPLLTAEVASTVTASAFATTAWTGWTAVGSTADGWAFGDSLSTDDVEAAESYYPVKTITTKREAHMTLVLQEITASNLKLALNTGTASTTGAAATLLTEIVPPTVGNEVRRMWGWQSEDNTVRFYAYQALQVGDIGTKFTKGADNAQLAFDLKLEVAAAGVYKIQLAGATRGA
jgi:hypothetical protein